MELSRSISFRANLLGTIGVPQVEAVDTMGAGDILHGAYCFFASTGRGFIESLAEAAKVASESCRHAGAREWMKHLPASGFQSNASGPNTSL